MLSVFENLCPCKTYTEMFIASLIIIAKTVSNQDVLQQVKE